MHKRIAIPILLTMLVIGWSAQAQTMSSALEQAWSRHPLAASSTLNRSAAQARVDLASGLTPGPASLSLSTLNDQIGANRGKQEWELEVETPLWLPGQRSAAQAEANATRKELESQQLALRLQLAGEVREAWWALAQAQSNYTLAVARHTAAQDLKSDVERRTRAGELARVDFNLAQMEQLATQSEVDEAHSTLQQTEQNYRLLTGTVPPDKLEPESLAAPTTPEHPQILAAAATTLAAQTKLALAQKSQREAPTVALRLVRERSDFSDTYADALGLKLTIPFSLGARVRQELDVNHAQAVQVEAEYAQTVRRIALAQETSQRLLKTTQFQLELANQRTALTQDNLALLEKSFALGESDLPTLLRARAAHFDAQALLHRQQINVHTAVSRVNQSLGVLP
ncbi:MAG: TolC family protein [Burkholderiales bacterium]|nr:TolC family protein [Burkholderiales bacterium]